VGWAILGHWDTEFPQFLSLLLVKLGPHPPLLKLWNFGFH
jgi:hypothetical protein